MVTRRTLLKGALGSGMLLLLTACGNQPSAPAAKTDAGAAKPAESKPAAPAATTAPAAPAGQQASAQKPAEAAKPAAADANATRTSRRMSPPG